MHLYIDKLIASEKQTKLIHIKTLKTLEFKVLENYPFKIVNILIHNVNLKFWKT